MNINDRVRVILTDEGLDVYRDFYSKIKEECQNLPYWEGHIERTDKTFNTSLWHFMEIFGPYTHMGMPLLFKDNEIEIVN
jgi:hypothetical protein